MSRLNERIENFNKALQIFNDAVSAYNKGKENILTHMALIQSYEVCFDVTDYKTLNHEGMKNSIDKYGKLFYSDK